jgi:hypothetical protein
MYMDMVHVLLALLSIEISKTVLTNCHLINNLPMVLVVSCNCSKSANPDEITIQRYALVVSIGHSDPQGNLYNGMRLQINQIDQRERNRARV